MIPNCTVMAEMGHSTFLRISLILNLIVAIGAIPILITAALYLRKQQLFHINTRIQIQFHICALIMHCFGRIALHLPDLINYFSNFENGCEIIPDFYRCFYARGLYNIGITITEMCSIALVIERSVALLFHKTYEYFPTSFGFGLVFLQLALSFCFLFKLYYHAPFKPSEDVVLYYCQTLASTNASVWVINAPLYTVMIAQIVCKFIFEYLNQHNHKMRNTHVFLTLSSKYNLTQGKRSITVLKIFVNVNIHVYATLSIVETTLHATASYFSRPTYFAIVEIIHIFPLYGIALSFYTYKILRQLNNSLRIEMNSTIRIGTDRYHDQFRIQIS